VQIEPALATPRWQDQRFTVFVTAEDLSHNGSIAYDDDDDGVADRQVPSNGLGAFELRINYDPGVLTLESAAPGPALAAGSRSFQCLQRNDPGAFAFGCVSAGGSAGPQGDMTLASITFGLAGGSRSWLTLEAQLAGPLGDDILVAARGGAVSIEGAPQPTPTQAGGSPNTPTREPGQTATQRPLAATATAAALATVAAAGTAGTPATNDTATPRPTGSGSQATDEPTEPGTTGGSAADPPNSDEAGGSGRSAAQIALLSLGTVAGLSAAGLGAFWFAGRLSRGRHPPPGPWP
jgi:hypothetical protein